MGDQRHHGRPGGQIRPGRPAGGAERHRTACTPPTRTPTLRRSASRWWRRSPPEIAALAGGVHSGLGTGGMGHQGAGRPHCHGCRGGYGDRQRRHRRPAVRHCGGKTGGHPLCRPEVIIPEKKESPHRIPGRTANHRPGPAIKEAFALTTHEILLAAQSCTPARWPWHPRSEKRGAGGHGLWLWWPPGRRFWRQPPGSGCRPGQGVRGDAGPSGPDQHPPG